MSKKYLKENMSEDEIIAELKELQIDQYRILSDGSVDVDENVYVFHSHLTPDGKLKIRLNNVKGAFDCSMLPLTSLEGGPRTVTKGYRIHDLERLKSLEGIASEIGGDLKMHKTGITSLVGISDMVKRVNGAFVCDFDKIKEGGLGLLTIKDLKSIKNDNSGQLPKPFEIISSYIGKPDEIFDCQSELIDAGFEDFAQL